MTNAHGTRYWAAGLLAALFALAGCGDEPKTGEVTGSITVDNEMPVEGSYIDFIPTDGKSATAGSLVQQGKYSARVPVGMSKVVIRVPKLSRKAKGKPTEGPGPGPGDGIVEGELLPERYNEKSELTFDVKSGKNEKDWNLSTKP